MTYWNPAATAKTTCSSSPPHQDLADNNISERGLRPTKTYLDAIRPDLASSLNNLSASLADLGRREDALAAIKEAAQV